MLRTPHFIKFFIIVFGFTFLSAFWLYPFNEKIEIPAPKSSEDLVYISTLKSEKPSLRSAFADALQVPLSLKWYDVHIENNSSLKENDCIEMDAGSPILQIRFGEGNPDEFASSTFKKNFESEPLSKIKKVNAGERGVFTYKGDKGFSYRIAHLWGGKCPKDSPIIKRVANINYIVYAKPNMVAWWTKFFILLFIWLFICDVVLNHLKR